MSLLSVEGIGKGSQQGVALLEAMLGLFILGIGLLGMASLQNQAVKASNTAHLYTQANWLAASIIENARVNRDQLDDYAVNFADTVTASTDCEITNCTEAQLADWDLSEWKNDLADLLPQGQGEVTVNGQEITVLVRFDDDAGDQSGTTSTDALLQIQVSSRL